MKNRWTDNLVLKISSLAIAFFLWIVVINISNPIVTRSQNVPLEIINSDIITGAGKTYTVMGGSTVMVSYEVRTRDEGKISSTDFKATIDLGDLYDITGAVPISVEVVNNKNLIAGAVSVKPSIARVSMEDLQRKEFLLSTKLNGTPSNGYSVGEITLDETTVVVTGPVSVIGQISQVGVEIDVEGLYHDKTGEAGLQYFDANGNAFNIQDERVTKSFDKVGYSVTILNGKTLTLNFNVGGTVAEGYRFTGAESTTKSIRVRGQPEDLGDLSVINIPEAALSVEGATGDVNTVVDVKDFLPPNVIALGETKITVTLKVEALDRKFMSLSLDDLIIKGARSGMVTNITPERITVVISGLSENLDNIEDKDLKASLDITDMREGSNTGSLTFELPAGFSVDSYTPFEVIIGNNVNIETADTTADTTAESTTKSNTEDATESSTESSIEDSTDSNE